MEEAEQVEPREMPGSAIPLFEPASDGARAIAAFAVGVLALLILLIPVGWWSELAGAIRSVLEALPLGDAVAERRREEGNPVLVGVLATIFVAALIVATTLWRRRAARNYVWGGLTFGHLYATSVLRTLAIFGGLSLVPNMIAVAQGTDLREEPEQTFTGPVWAIIILLFWATFSYWGLRRLVDQEAGDPPSVRERREAGLSLQPAREQSEAAAVARDPLE